MTGEYYLYWVKYKYESGNYYLKLLARDKPISDCIMNVGVIIQHFLFHRLAIEGGYPYTA